MAIVNNPLLKGFRGKLGDMIFKVRGGKTYVSQAPAQRKNKNLSPREIEVREKFALRTQMAKELLSNPEIAAIYASAKTSSQSAHNIAFRDISHAPEVLDIQADDYQGVPGENIIIEAVDDFKVKSVTVTITGSDHKIIERGEAVLLYSNIYWLYTVQKRNRKVEGCLIKAIATDIPGNKGTMETVITRDC